MTHARARICCSSKPQKKDLDRIALQVEGITKDPTRRSPKEILESVAKEEKERIQQGRGKSNSREETSPTAF